MHFCPQGAFNSVREADVQKIIMKQEGNNFQNGSRNDIDIMIKLR